MGRGVCGKASFLRKGTHLVTGIIGLEFGMLWLPMYGFGMGYFHWRIACLRLGIAGDMGNTVTVYVSILLDRRAVVGTCDSFTFIYLHAPSAFCGTRTASCLPIYALVGSPARHQPTRVFTIKQVASTGSFIPPGTLLMQLPLSSRKGFFGTVLLPLPTWEPRSH